MDNGDGNLEHAQSQPVVRQSRWGMASLAFSAVAIASAALAIVLDSLLGVHGDVPPLWAIACVGTCLVSLLAGLASGITGVLQKRARRGAAAAGIAIATVFLLFLALWTGVGR